jgi:hypothetical protein
MIDILMRAKVADYAKWRAVFDDNQSWRRSIGATGAEQVYCAVEDPNAVTILLEWDNAENARKFLQDPQLRTVMQKAGVISVPESALLTRA